jgi:protein ImuA
MVTHGEGGARLGGVVTEAPPAAAAAFGGLKAWSTEWCATGGRPWETVSSGFRALDGLLSAGGVRRGSLVEWWPAGDAAVADAAGAVTLACAVACRLAGTAGRATVAAGSTTAATTIVVVDRGGRFHPPAVMPWLAGPSAAGGKASGGPQLVVVRPARHEDELWAIDQSLRCPAVAAVVAWPGRLSATAMRRLQLAVRSSGAVGLLIRGLHLPQQERSAAPATVRQESWRSPSWADVRLTVSPVEPAGGVGIRSSERRLRLAVVGGAWAGGLPAERSVEVRLDLSTGRESVGRHAADGRPSRLVRQEEPVCRAS